ncbi:hypothetical protein FACS1894211_03700 [Clostridia bacterium]|nr:hypothetical protein FACS1894211_03700 [Clostridia bacterium]
MLAATVFAGCAKKPKHAGFTVDKSNLFGIDEPLWEKGSPDASNNNFQVKGFDLDKTVGLIEALGAKSFRLRFPREMVTNPSATDGDMIAYFTEAAAKLRAAGVKQIIGTSMIFPAYTDFRPDSAYSAPHVDDPAYGPWLDAVTTLWKKLAALFPDITYWEMGNEFNMNTFYHPNGYVPPIGNVLGEGANGFTQSELAAQCVNYMYYASKGIRAGNPSAVTVMPGLSCGPGGMGSRAVEYFIGDMYGLIKSGSYPYGADKSTDCDDYFMCLNWHPYVLNGDLDASWLKYNNDVYAVAKKNGDDGKKVFFTEFGFTDMGDSGVEERQIGFMNQAFKYAKDDMPYVESICAFRLYECEFAANWGGTGETYFGYFKEPSNGKGFSPKAKAFALQTLYGGSGDLRRYE